jgi:hypothetical protein
MASKIIRHAMTIAFVATISVAGISPATAGPDFPTAVGQILQAQQKGPVSKLPVEKKQELIACVNGVLTALPKGKQRYVVEAANFDELEDRFGEVVMENRAEWKQRIAKSCSHIVV